MCILPTDFLMSIIEGTLRYIAACRGEDDNAMAMMISVTHKLHVLTLINVY